MNRFLLGNDRINHMQIAAFVFLFLIVMFIVLTAVQRRQIIEKYLVRPEFERKYSQFAAHPIAGDDIIFLGDSITEAFHVDEIFPDLPVKNRGISGDTTNGVLERLHQITAGQPQKIFLMIGSNDLGFGYSEAHVIANYETILARIRQESPGTQVYVQSILPRKKRYAHKITAVNAAIAALAPKYGCQFIDLFPEFADEMGTLRPEFTNDDLHLLDTGYTLWSSLIAPYVSE